MTLTETILEDVIKRLTKVEEALAEIKKQPAPTQKPKWQSNPNAPATERQLIALAQAGAETWAGMTQQDVTAQFKSLNNKSSENKPEPKEQIVSDPPAPDFIEELREEYGEDPTI